MGSRFLRGALICGIVLFLAIGLAVAINPSLYSEPVKFVRAMLGLRMHIAEVQRQMIYQMSLPTWPIRLAAFLRATLLENDPFLPIPVFVLAFSTLAGVPCIFPLWRHDPPQAWIVGIYAAGWVTISLFAYVIDASRYLLVIFPFVCLVAGAGFEQVITLFGGWTRRWTRRIAILFGLAFLQLLLLTFVGTCSMQNFMAENPAWVEKAKAAAAALQQQDAQDAENPQWHNMLDGLSEEFP